MMLRRVRRELAAVHYKHDGAAHVIAKTLRDVLPQDRPIWWVCIGSDRSTGDALGPLVGSALLKAGIENVWGTLGSLVHGGNLNDVRSMIYGDASNPYVVAVDAMLGAFRDVGQIHVRCGSLTPGRGIGKSLLPIGDMHVAGTVDLAGGLTPSMILMTTPLSRVMAMASVIADGISMAMAVRRGELDAAATGAAT